VSADEITRVSVDQLLLWPGNPRRGNREAIRESIRVNGVYKPLLVQRGTGQVLVGNNTLTEAIDLGHREIDVIYKDVDDETARRIMLADNRTSDVSGYDESLLYEALLTMDDLTGTGWSLDDVEELMRSVAEPIEVEGVFPGIDDGDVLVLGEVRTGADWAELPQQTEARAERQAAQTVSAARGVREIMLVYIVEEHEEMILLLDGLKRAAGGDTRYPQIVQELVRRAARDAGLV
jgi:ParB-like chromosome segregation protein Spo0J